jgi:hypothetical protein
VADIYLNHDYEALGTRLWLCVTCIFQSKCFLYNYFIKTNRKCMQYINIILYLKCSLIYNALSSLCRFQCNPSSSDISISWKRWVIHHACIDGLFRLPLCTPNFLSRIRTHRLSYRSDDKDTTAFPRRRQTFSGKRMFSIWG